MVAIEAVAESAQESAQRCRKGRESEAFCEQTQSERQIWLITNAAAGLNMMPDSARRRTFLLLKLKGGPSWR